MPEPGADPKSRRSAAATGPPPILDTLAFLPIDAVAADAVEALLDRAFGTDRHGRTAYRLRAGTRAIPGLSLAATDADGGLVASLQCWPIRLAADDGGAYPLTLVGPVAVAPERQGSGLGSAIIRRALGRLDATGAAPGLLIGDPEYYGRFGFADEATGGWRLPGPVERRRLLARLPASVALPAAGDLGPEPA